MQRELNPDLFGEGRAQTQRSTEAYSPAYHQNFTAPIAAAPSDFEKQLSDVKNQFQQVLDQMQKLNGAWSEFSQHTHFKFEKIQQNVSRLEQNHNGFVLDSGQKLTQLNVRLNERKALDLKIQEMVDRHNSVIKSFEVRMNHLQKLLSEKESQMIATQSALNEAKMEISRLKRL
ncbi:MAG: hypothetical protein ACOYOK_01970 [Pseudobdellovibrionaceae bacterium]|jgi:chromosome segregation ATPase